MNALISKRLVGYVIKAAIRDKLVIGLGVLLLMAVSLSLFMGGAAINEQDQFVAVFSAGSIRILNAVGLTLFIVFFIRRSFEMRDVEFMLSRPVSRTQLVISYAAGFSVLSILLALVSSLCIYALSPHLFSEGHVLWAVSLIMENIIIANAALFFSMVLTSAASGAFATLGFYVLARMMSQILGIIDSSKGIVDAQSLELLMQIISALMPRMDIMTQTSWLVYGTGDSNVGFGFVFAQGIIYSALILTAALLDMRRRQF